MCCLIVFVWPMWVYRVFSYGDLAQMKHIYPEAIELKRVLKYDEGITCMRPSLHINLNTDTVVLDDTSCGTKYMELRKVFHSKLVDFHKAHPKVHITIWLWLLS